MKIDFDRTFNKAYKKRIFQNAKLVANTRNKIALFKENRYHPLLNDHALEGKLSHLRAFSVTGDFRIVYYPVSEDHILFLDIGTHNHVY